MSKNFKRIVGEAIGEASMCWSEIPKGVFDSEHASRIIDKIVEAHNNAPAVEVELDEDKFVENIEILESVKPHFANIYSSKEYYEWTIKDMLRSIAKALAFHAKEFVKRKE